jgi:hypothetical protein
MIVAATANVLLIYSIVTVRSRTRRPCAEHCTDATVLCLLLLSYACNITINNRDKRRQLHLYNVDTDTRTTLLNYCTYVQWVPDSDVVVAQTRNTLSVWYNIHAPDQVSSICILILLLILICV